MKYLDLIFIKKLEKYILEEFSVSEKYYPTLYKIDSISFICYSQSRLLELYYRYIKKEYGKRFSLGYGNTTKIGYVMIHYKIHDGSTVTASYIVYLLSGISGRLNTFLFGFI